MQYLKFMYVCAHNFNLVFITSYPSVSSISLATIRHITEATTLRYDTFITMSGHSSTPHAHPATITDDSTDAHPANPPAHFTAGNSFGPYVFNGITTNRPHPQFLDSISDPILLKLKVPYYLHTNHNSTHNLPYNNTTVDTFRFYLCASLARHYSYKKAYLKPVLTNPKLDYRKMYYYFQIHFTTALESLINGKTPTPRQQDDLVNLDRDLTHETFALQPDLFDRSFQTNFSLLQTLSLEAPSLLARRSHPLVFLTSLIEFLEENWIDLADAEDILDPRPRHSRIWSELERQRRQLVMQLDSRGWRGPGGWMGWGWGRGRRM